MPNNPMTGELDYAATVDKPVRGAIVQIISGETVLASATLSEQGTYTFTLAPNTSYAIRVRAELIKTSGTATWSVVAKDNTNGGALWAVETAPQTLGAADVTRDLAIPSGWSDAAGSYVGDRPAAAFAIMDTIYSSMQVVAKAQPGIAFPPLTVFWSANNRNVFGNVDIGEIGTSFFTFESATTSAGTSITRSMYILGAQDLDTDEYDSSVVAHEYGHYLQSAFSTSHSLGGQHGSRDKLDMTVAFSEGFGNAWSSMARGNPQYVDTLGFRQGAAGIFDVTTTPLEAGWFKEDSIQFLLYNFFVNQGFAPIWSALTGPLNDNRQDALASIFSFAAAVRSVSTSAISSALNALLAAQNINGTDQWGSNESNAGGTTGALPVYTSMTLGAPTQACLNYANQELHSPQANKLGAVKYFHIKLGSSGLRTITANFPSGRDIDFEVFQNRAVVAVANSAAPTSESIQVNLSAGEVVIRLYDAESRSAPSLANCANLIVN